MSRRRRSALAQAQADAALTYDPQRRDLHSALTDAGRTRSSDVRAAQISGGALAHQIRQSLGPLGRDYALASRIGDVNNNDVLNALAGQSGVGGYLATIRGDRALNATLGARELANAKGSLRLQANQALQGAVNDVANVRSNYQSLAGKIRSQLSGLTADQAKYVALNAPKIEQQMVADARAAQAAADAHRAARDLHRQRTQKNFVAGPFGQLANTLGKTVAGIGKPLVKTFAPPKITPPQQGAAISQINKAVAVVRQFQAAAKKANKKIDYPTLEQHLLVGYRAKKGEIGIPAIGSAGPIPNTVLVRSGLELARHGRLSDSSYNALYGVSVPHAWRPYRPRRPRSGPRFVQP
jgi:hypothetical protein